MSRAHPKFKVKKKRWGRYPYLSVIFSATLALFVIGVFGVLIIYSKELEKGVREEIKIQVFLHNKLNEREQSHIKKMIEKQYFVRQGSNAITFISKKEAAKQFIAETGEDFQRLLGTNPLRDAFLVSIDEYYHDKESMLEAKKKLEKISGVFQVYYVETLIDSINKNVAKVSLILLTIAILLLFTAILLVSHTIKLALFSQRELIRSMQLVGATHWFIQKPFLYRSIWHGFLAGVLASISLSVLVRYGNIYIEGLSIIYNEKRILILLVTLIFLGIIVTSLSAYQVVKKYVYTSHKELY